MISHSFKRLFFLGFVSVTMSGCVLYELGEPPLGETDIWSKPGHTRAHIYLAIMKCRQESTGNTSREKTEAEELCMLRAGYKFVNGRASRPVCKPGEKDPWAWNTPGCRSLRGELIITPDQSASLPPQVVDESPPAHTYAPDVPIAPSISLGQRMQDKIQNDSNVQMNQLLQGGGQ